MPPRLGPDAAPEPSAEGRAEAALIKAEQLLSKAKGVQRRSSLEALVALYTATGDATKAASWKAKLGQ